MSVLEKRVYQHAPAYDEGYLQVSDIHRLHYEQYGNPNGKPAIFLHGGPGGSTSIKSTVYFDPAVYRVVVFDQRGAGRSQPLAELRDNTTTHLVSDIEVLREHVGVSKWHTVFGGSWGSTLGLLYAEAHPDRVGCLVLRGIFLADKEGWRLSTTEGIASRLFPEVFEEWCDNVPVEYRDDVPTGYHKLMSSDDPAVSLKAAKDYSKLCMPFTTVDPGPNPFKELDNDDWCWSHGRLECYYLVKKCFLEPDQIINNIDKIKHIPCTIVHGRYDLICNPIVAWKLHKAMPSSECHMIPAAGHSAGEPGIHNKLIDTCDKYGLQDFHKS